MADAARQEAEALTADERAAEDAATLVMCAIAVAVIAAVGVRDAWRWARGKR